MRTVTLRAQPHLKRHLKTLLYFVLAPVSAYAVWWLADRGQFSRAGAVIFIALVPLMLLALGWRGLKGLGIVPLGTAVIGADSIVVKTPIRGAKHNRPAPMVPGRPITLFTGILQRGRVSGVEYVFAQGENGAILRAPEPISEASFAELSAALAEAGSPITVRDQIVPAALVNVTSGGPALVDVPVIDGSLLVAAASLRPSAEHGENVTPSGDVVRVNVGGEGYRRARVSFEGAPAGSELVARLDAAGVSPMLQFRGPAGIPQAMVRSTGTFSGIDVWRAPEGDPAELHIHLRPQGQPGVA